MKCQHFPACGGCSCLDVPYGEQLKIKGKEILAIAERFQIDGSLIAEIIPSPSDIFYRNKMEFVVTPGNPREGSCVFIGLRKKNKFNEVVNIRECKLFSEKTQAILDTARRWAVDSKVQPYNLNKESGILRYLVLRESKNTGEVMANLIVSMTPYSFQYEFKSKAKKLSDSLAGAGIGLSCFSVGLNEKKTDTALSENNYMLYGREYIEDKIGKLTYAVYPYTFFQVNSPACEKLYDTARSFVGPYRGTTAFDLYCGSGGITLYVADVFEKLIGLEFNKQAIDNARVNARINNINNCEFVCSQAEDVMKKIDRSKFRVKLSTVIVDPPRPGLSKKTLASIVELNPMAIVYVSCKFETMARDLQTLTQFYKIIKIQPVDMFPHTPHVELVALLEHK